MAASEALPYAKSGGSCRCPGEPSRKPFPPWGCRVHLFLPCYRTVREKYPDLEEMRSRHHSHPGRVGLVRRPAPSPSRSRGHRLPSAAGLPLRQGGALRRGGKIGYRDNLLRFALMCRAVLAAIPALGSASGPLPPSRLAGRPSSTLPAAPAGPLSRPRREVPSLFTIHNMA